MLSLGSNLGDRMVFLRLAVELLEPYAVSPVYETAPVGGPQQGDFLNAVVLLDADAATAWERAQIAEQRARRAREERWGPRTLDVDVVWAKGQAAGLLLPHPRAAERAFVLAPWADVQPDAVLPGRGRVKDLLAMLDLSGIRRREDLVLG
ncbi:MAG: 2-amino-4-hydroxy-6-hydroxymethyldihydropteridine diphosphokinase [Actinobacteria bacterium]|nr:2-amino-4-hydroxy-6-hydroxymethyldihydropteridine diphosphokinase [Actinomycetota bacterium]MCA1720425.1 2-amino-4-hydroxy-6-hydroxymethyldihydropteridine diphosphokinase [Actinomycetota bacterium]